MRYVTSRARTPLSIIVALTTLLIACAPAPPAAPSKPAAPAATTAPAAPTAAPAAAKPTEAPAKPAVAVPTAVAAKPTTAPVAAAPAKPAGEPTTWTIAVQGEAECFDVAICSNGILPNSIRRPMFEPLLQIEGEKLDYIPKLAESWKQIDDTTWDFFLRKNVKFHNGDPFTAEDVLYSYQLYSVDSAPNRTYTRIIESVTAPDPFTVRVKLNTPSTEFLQNTTSMSIMSKAYREKVGSDGYNKAPVGTGPYKFVEYKAGVHLVMEVDPSYWGGKATPDRLVMRPITDPATRVAELKTGGVDIIAAPPLTQLDQLNQGNTEVAALNGAVTIMYFFKTKEKPFDDKRVRQAINYAVDRQSIFKDVLQGQGTLLHGPWASPAWPGYDPNLQPYPYDPAKAKQLLAEAGYANGFETTLNLTNGAQLKDREIAEAIAGQLGEVGIKVRLIPTDPAKLNDIWKAGTFDGILQGRWAAPADPGTMINYSFDQANSQAVDPKMKELVKGIQSTFDNEKRLALLRELGTYANDYAPWLFMHAQNEFYAKRRGNPWTPVPVYSFGSVLWLQLPSR